MDQPLADKVRVLDAAGRRLSPCTGERAQGLVDDGKAEWADGEIPTIRLRREIELPPPPVPPEPPGKGRRLLLHACCGPCTTYPALHLRQQEFAVSAFWYNPNIHPFAEHERRREALRQFAGAIDLPLIEWPDYEMVEFLRAVAGREAHGQRCRICYRMRLERTAQAAQERGFAAFTTTLLISPYQDEDLIRAIGEEAGRTSGVEFYYERLRRGWSERGRLAKVHELYRQDYCGCIYSEWESRRGLPKD
ncbi:MAG: epoxyqueuosine reductase QueH [Chloroflexia bacterium]|nr:epoxyqueuosine reductase QueH [Chloroflexia bacterium]